MIVKNSIIIFDEGHNIERSAEEGASLSLSTIDLINCGKEVNLVIEHNDASKKWSHITESDANLLKFLISKLGKIILAKGKLIKGNYDEKGIKKKTEEGKLVINSVFANILRVSKVNY